MNEDDWQEYESGSYCIHWNALWECERICECGHYCREHDFLEKCEVSGCSCMEIKGEDLGI
jgi:hypothetical protein